ncbi:SRPBCC family protein [Flavobacterium sp. '19STA2R22 D10 B1']|uniref:SRPBCC family protein n=1 Tax=Flavobacterium aerium TaxID=3037261 RepID=UPI00278C2FAA|nr:SRPBCC family protein [Flavobacterium sp. '19STA2R22 D10 B1']
MKIFKKIIIALAILVGILLIAGLFLKKDYSVEREIVINKPKQEVFDYIKLLKNQDYFSKWSMQDPNAVKTYRGIDGTPGFVATWNSKNNEVGAGEQEIKKITEGDRMDVELRFKVPFESTENAYFITEAISPTQTKVKWGFNGHTGYPMNLMCVFMNFEGMVGNDLNIGLINLKGVLEKK